MNKRPKSRLEGEAGRGAPLAKRSVETVSGKTLVAILRRLPYWQQLMAEYEARGEWLRPYSLRDTFSVRAHGIVKDDTLIAAAMGHTVEVHHRSYRTSEWRSVRKAFAKAR